jgi:hypothetical protein
MFDLIEVEGSRQYLLCGTEYGRVTKNIRPLTGNVSTIDC